MPDKKILNRDLTYLLTDFPFLHCCKSEKLFIALYHLSQTTFLKQIFYGHRW